MTRSRRRLARAGRSWETARHPYHIQVHLRVDGRAGPRPTHCLTRFAAVLRRRPIDGTAGLAGPRDTVEAPAPPRRRRRVDGVGRRARRRSGPPAPLSRHAMSQRPSPAHRSSRRSGPTAPLLATPCPSAPRQRIGQICSNRESVHPPSACLDAGRHVETPLPRSGTPKSRRTGLDLAAAAAEGSVAVRSARTAPSRGEPATLTPSMRRVRCNATPCSSCFSGP